MIRCETECSILQTQKAAEQQPKTNQQDQRQGDLTDDQCAPKSEREWPFRARVAQAIADAVERFFGRSGPDGA